MTELIGATAHAGSSTRRRVVEWADPSVSASSAAGLTGVDFLRAIASGELPQPPVAALLGMRLVEIDAGMGCAVHSKLALGQGYTTLELKVNFDRALTVAVGVVRAEADIVTSGRRVATAVGRLVGPDGTLFAHASTTCLVFEVGQ